MTIVHFGTQLSMILQIFHEHRFLNYYLPFEMLFYQVILIYRIQNPLFSLRFNAFCVCYYRSAPHTPCIFTNSSQYDFNAKWGYVVLLFPVYGEFCSFKHDTNRLMKMTGISKLKVGQVPIEQYKHETLLQLICSQGG